MHNGRALHAQTHTLALTLGDSLSYQGRAGPGQLRATRRNVWGGAEYCMMGDGSLHAPLSLHTPTRHLFPTFILARGCFCGLTRGFDRRHPLPVGPVN